MRNRSLSIFFAFITVLTILIISNQCHSEQSKLRMGFVGGRSPEGITREWVPLIEYLSVKLGMPVELVLREDYQGLIDAMKAGELDLSEGGAYTQLKAIESGVAELFMGEIRQGLSTYRSFIIVRADDVAKSIEDLKGRVLALTDELSTSGYLVPRVMFDRAGIKDPSQFFERIILTGGQDLSLTALMDGDVDVIAVGDYFFLYLSEGERSKYRVIAQSEPVPMGPITINKNITGDFRERIKRAFLDYSRDVSDEVKATTEIDSFYEAQTSNLDAVRGYISISNTLPKVDYEVPYRKIPSFFADRASESKRRAVAWFLGLQLIFLSALVIIAMVYRRRISISVGLVVAGVIAVISIILTSLQLFILFQSIDEFAVKKISLMENANLRAVISISGLSVEPLGEIVSHLHSDDSILWAAIFKDGKVIASDRSDEVGTAIVDQIRTNKFNRDPKRTISFVDPIVVKGRRYANLHTGISLQVLDSMVLKAISSIGMSLIFAFAAGLVTTAMVRRRLARPISEIAEAIEQMREGEVSIVETNDYEVKPIARSIATLGRELKEKQDLSLLKAATFGRSSAPIRQEQIDELKERIQEIEQRNEGFRALRLYGAIGESPAWLATLRDAAIRARDREPVVIFGPTGAGKTCIAKAVHLIGPRSDRPFGEFNCAEFVSGDPLVVLGKLFGYGEDCGIVGINRKGQRGILEDYDGGTIFFDEAELLPMQAQQLLLLPLEGRAFNPAAGKRKPKLVDVRFVFATNIQLDDLVHSGKMRSDFLRRVQSRGIIDVPPLSERRDDIEMLAIHFLAHQNFSLGSSISFSHKAIRALASCGFHKYNVSELAGMVRQSFENASFAKSEAIELEHLPAGLDIDIDGVQSAPNMQLEDERRELEVLRSCNFKLSQAEKLLGFSPGSRTLTHHMRGFVYQALDDGGWDIEAAVKSLGGNDINAATGELLRTKIKDYMASMQGAIERSSVDRLFLKLPRKYHKNLERLIAAISSGAVKIDMTDY